MTSLSPTMLGAGGWGGTWLPGPKSFHATRWSAVGEWYTFARERGGWQMEHSGEDEGCAELRVVQGIDDQNSSLLCLCDAHGNQGFGLLRLTPALLTKISWLFLSISICCLCSVRAANSLGFRAFWFCVCALPNSMESWPRVNTRSC